MQSLTTEVWISSRCLTTGHSVAEGSQHPFASSVVQQGPCRTATCLTLESPVGGGLPAIAVDQLMNPRLRDGYRGRAGSHMGWRRALFQGNSEKAVHDWSAAQAGARGATMKIAGHRKM